MMKSVDVLIAGAGPAGCALGLLLHRAGANVLVAEARDARHKDKLCGGVLNSKATTLFADIYGDGALERLRPHRTERLVSRAWNTSLTSPCIFHVMPRERFDGYCLARYEEAGGGFADRMRLLRVDRVARVASFRDGRTGSIVQIGYRVLVGADGALSAVRRSACGHAQHVTVAMQGVAPLPDGLSADEVVSDQRTGEHGTCWFIPQSSDAAVVGFLFHHADMAYVRERLNGFCADLGFELAELRGAPIPVGDDVLLGVGDDIWLVGDAAGLIDAGTGAGIHHALHSARALASALTGGMPYEQAMAATVENVRAQAAMGEDYNLLACMSIVLAAQREAEQEW